MKYIVLTKQQNLFLLDFKRNFQHLLLERNVDVEPIEIKNELFILNEDLFLNVAFAELKDALETGGHLANLVIREIDENEFIQYEI